MSASSLLLIEDNPGDARLLREMFAEGETSDMEMVQVGCMREAEVLLTERAVDIILLDLGLPDTEGVGAVQRAHAAAPRIPLVVLTGLDDESMALLALQEGAQDYLVKGQIEARGLVRALRYAVERKNMEEALYAEKERAQVTLDCIGDAVICANAAGDITFLNVMAESLTGWLRHDAEGRPMSDVFRMLDASSREVVRIPTGAALEPGGTSPLPSSCILVRRDGVECPIEDSVAPIHDREGRGTGVVVAFRDVSAVRETSLRMIHSAQHDFLTGLPNRMLLADRLGQAIVLARRHSKQTAVLFLDLDGFKHINDSLGHSVGDRLLQSVARRLVECARASDTVSRQGGDEFVVLLSEMEHPEDAAIAARRILKAISAVHTVDEHDLYVTTSIGVSVYPEDGLDAETLIKNADTAVYQAKENGRQSYQFFKPAMNARAVERQSIEQNLRRALERNEFTLHYQPKIDFKTGAISGAEALLRWTHPTRGPISPAQFIPVAEDSGLILPIGSWVLREACRQARAWVDAGLPMTTMAVNVSAKELRDESFLDGVFATLDETRLNPGSLELELTESVLMKHAESAASILRSVRERGVQVAVDDFGTGYSSLSYLGKFPVDALKIDQSFVGQITAAGDDASIVTAVISMARSLRLRVVAEGVETLEQLEFLEAHGCDEAQGYYFSRPVPAEQFARLLSSGISRPAARASAAPSAPARAPGRSAPRVGAPGARRDARPASGAPGPALPCLRHRVLIVDGDPSVGRSLRRDVKARVFDIETAGTPDEANLRVTAARPDLVVLDLGLPDDGALKLLRLWKRQTPTLPVILVSRTASLTAVIEALKEGARGFFSKPVTSTVLLNQIAAQRDGWPTFESGPTLESPLLAAGHRLGMAALRAEGVDRFFAICPGLMSVAGFDGHFKVLNPAWEQTLGYSVDELCAMPYLDFVHPDDQGKAMDEAIEVQGGQTVFRFKNRYRCKDGSYRWLAWSVTPSPGQGLIYGAARDITKSVRMAQGLRGANSRLKQMVVSRELLLHESSVKNDSLVELGRFKDEVAAMIIHDLKNPLSVILSNYDYILEGFDGPAESREALEESHAAGQRMLRLLANLVDVARLENGTLAVLPSEVTLTRLFQSVIEQRRVLARARKIKLVFLPSPERTVVVDADLLTRTVENILDNALRYTDDGGRIEIELRDTGDEFEIRIGNSGPAIPPEARRTIFDKYGQAGAEVGRRNLGLGLYFCRLAIEAQGGRIWVGETEALPALFGIRLPCRVTGTARPTSPAAVVSS
jgi:diguanylate cyclase (GGDEF)-like protein/PAS domain S-box-containing protein